MHAKYMLSLINSQQIIYNKSFIICLLITCSQFDYNNITSN